MGELFRLGMRRYDNHGGTTLTRPTRDYVYTYKRSIKLSRGEGTRDHITGAYLTFDSLFAK